MVPLAPRAAGTHANEAIPRKDVARAMRFDTKYPLLLKIGWIALFAMPILMLVTLILFEGSLTKSSASCSPGSFSVRS